MKSDSGYEQATCAIKIIRNYARLTETAVHDLHSFGAI